MNKLNQILKQIIADGLLEDRLEYSVEDLARMYTLTLIEAIALSRMIKEAAQ